MYMAQRDKSKDLKVDDIGSYASTQADIGEKDLVQGRINNVMNDSNLRKQAIGTAKSQANSRGLINSQMSTQGAVAELYKAALPIASQDSTTITEGKKFDATTKNDAGQFNTGEKNKGIIENIRGQLNMDAIYESGRSDYSVQELRGSQELDQIGARGVVEGTLQDKADAGAMDRLNVSGEQSIDQIAARAEEDRALQTQSDLAAFERLGLSGEQALAQILERGDIDINLQSQSDMAALGRLGISGSQALDQIEAQGKNSLNTQNAADDAAADRLETSGDQDLELEGLRASNDQISADIKAKNERLISANQAASLVFSNTQVAIANVLANADIPKANKQGFINILNGELENSLRAIGTFSDVDVTDLLPAVDGDDAGSDASNDSENYVPGSNAVTQDGLPVDANDTYDGSSDR